MSPEQLDTLFSTDGPLAVRLKAYSVRSQQVAMAERVAATLAENGVLVAEAGTGTGKTLAYLLPALVQGGKVIVSTATKALQDQLFEKDIPLARQVIGAPIMVARLKGRANYVCRYHLERNLADGRFERREDHAYLSRIARFAQTSGSGDKAECVSVPESHPVWQKAVSSRENCLGGDCPHHKTCFVLDARKQALAAELVVVNHHLFFADLWLKDEGVSELLPASNMVILDEAHQLEDTATVFFGETLTTGQCVELADDVERAARVHAGDSPALVQLCDALAKAARDVRLVYPAMPVKRPAEEPLQRAELGQALSALDAALNALGQGLEPQAERAQELAHGRARTEQLRTQLARWRDENTTDQVRWLETTPRAVLLHNTPLSVAELFGQQVRDDARAWVLTSATLSVAGDFSHLLSRLGLEGAETLAVDSPFDYARQGVLYVPHDLPEPNRPEHTDAVVDAALPVIAASGGRAFLLFTSLRALERARVRIEAAFKERAWNYPLLVQGDAPKNKLLDAFRAAGNAVLLGAYSFWEGVDVPGEALSVVIIDKLPFAPPDDPVIAARIRHLEASGGNGFMEFQLPAAAIALKQGAGRLIRTETDRGVLMLCDPRLVTKAYGKRLLAALPPMTLTRKLAVVQAFFDRANADPDDAQTVPVLQTGSAG
ncbi:MAG: ATP-dependent DNA helicase [Thiobacillaceae bacterium]